MADTGAVDEFRPVCGDVAIAWTLMKLTGEVAKPIICPTFFTEKNIRYQEDTWERY